MKKTKIICSVGPSSNSPSVMAFMVQNGMNVARINFSHATMDERELVISTVKEVREMTGQNVSILYDTKGPEFRNGKMIDGGAELKIGNTIRIVKDDVIGNAERFTVNHKGAIDSIEVGNTILLENGLMKIKVINKDSDSITCEILEGGILESKKSLSVPGVKLNMPFISDEDKEDLIYAVTHEADFIALSFVSTAEDVLEVKELLRDYNTDVALIAKIESTTGIENLRSIVAVSDGVMVARGDLGVEAPMEDLPYLQKLIIDEAHRQGKFSIVATEMLESMKKNNRPTRAEVSDIANAVMNGADAVMLSGETTTGKFPIETVKFMGDVCLSTERHLEYSLNTRNINRNVKGAIASSAVESANLINAKAIVVATVSGKTVQVISNLRSKCPIVATCINEKIARRLTLNWGVYPIVTEFRTTTDEIIADAISKARELIEFNQGDHIVITGGFPINKSTNFLRIEDM